MSAPASLTQMKCGYAAGALRRRAYATRRWNAIRRVDFDGKGPHKGEPYQVPNELSIHGEIYKKRPEVGCVIHAHPKEALICGITELEFRPIFGAFNITGHAHGARGYPGVSALLSRQPAGARCSDD